MKKRRWFGLSLFILGIGISLLNPFGSITGLAIAENIDFFTSWLLYFTGLILMTIGLMIARNNIK